MTGEEIEFTAGEDFQGTKDLNVMDNPQQDPDRASSGFGALPQGFLWSPEVVSSLFSTTGMRD